MQISQIQGLARSFSDVDVDAEDPEPEDEDLGEGQPEVDAEEVVHNIREDDFSYRAGMEAGADAEKQASE